LVFDVPLQTAYLAKGGGLGELFLHEKELIMRCHVWLQLPGCEEERTLLEKWYLQKFSSDHIVEQR
jgi:hypothetical protein